MQTTFLRLSIIAAASAAAISAHATSILLVSSGLLTDNNTTSSGSETVLAQVGGFGTLSTLTYTFVNSLPVTGTGTYTGSGGTLNYSFALTSFVDNGGSITDSGTWTETSGTGTYAKTTGSGTLTLTNTLNNSNVYPVGTTFGGTLNAVPEPTSLVALALGGVGIFCRRKRS